MTMGKITDIEASLLADRAYIDDVANVPMRINGKQLKPSKTKTPD